MNQKTITLELEEFKTWPVRYSPLFFNSSFDIMWKGWDNNGEQLEIIYNKKLYIYHHNRGVKVIIDENEFIKYLTEEYNIRIDNVFYW